MKKIIAMKVLLRVMCSDADICLLYATLSCVNRLDTFAYDLLFYTEVCREYIESPEYERSDTYYLPPWLSEKIGVRINPLHFNESKINF